MNGPRHQAADTGEKTVIFIHDEHVFVPVASEFSGALGRNNIPSRILTNEIDSDLSNHLWISRGAWQEEERMRNSLADIYRAEWVSNIRGSGIKLQNTKIRKDILKEKTTVNVESIAGDDRSYLTIGAGELGFYITVIFLSFIAIGAGSDARIIDPLVGWIGVLMGVTFMAMHIVGHRTG